MQLSEEDRNLLVRDLCGRVPYGVIVRVHVEGDNCHEGGDYDAILDCVHVWGSVEFDYDDLLERSRWGSDSIENVKPYLRKLNSMTEEEKEKYREVKSRILIKKGNNFVVRSTAMPLYTEFLNTHHFDYRGLIEKGLAIEVTKENNPYDVK